MNTALTETRTTATALARRFTRQDFPLPSSAGAVANPACQRQPWWLWPHLLSLDAPLVALVWQRWWARAAGVTLPFSREIILGLGVWLIYLADRLADSTDGNHRHNGAARHIFSGNRRNFLLPLALLVALALAVLTPRWLPTAEFRAGLGLLALALGYFWLVHGRAGRKWAVYLPKEAVVGGMFGVGSAFFVVCRSSHSAGMIWLGVGLFAVVCFLNCALITKWESHPRDLGEPSSLLNAFPRLSAHLGTACLLLASVAVAVSGATNSLLALPVAAGALLLTSLDHHKTRLSNDALRVLVDMVLLTPWLGLAWAAAAA